MCSAKYSIDDVEVSTSEAGHHLCEKVRPLLREVFPSYDADSITQLWTHRCTNSGLVENLCSHFKIRAEYIRPLKTLTCDNVPVFESVLGCLASDL